MNPESPKTPGWVWIFIAVFGLLPLLLHGWIAAASNETWAPSGFHIGDAPFFLTAMNMFNTGFASPYAVCDADSASWRYFALPHHWLYGILGAFATLIGTPHAIALALANGVCGALYVYAVYRFLLAVAPGLATIAFLLFALPGGLAGWCFLGAELFDLRPGSGFDGLFHRLARYELIEGPFLSPLLILPRLYYTLPLALGYAALTRLVRGEGKADWAVFLGLALASALNARAGILLWGAMACYLIARPRAAERSAKRDWSAAATLFLPAALGAALASLLLAQNPEGAQNVDTLIRRVAWAGSLFTMAVLHCFTLPFALRRALPGMPAAPRAVARLILGYLAAYAVFYLLHQAYYGNLLHGGDTAAALAVSPWALLGLAPAALWIGLRRHDAAPPASAVPALGWAALWFLGLLAVSISAFPWGLTLRHMPERGLVLLGPPLALLSAHGLALLREHSPRGARVWLATALASGLVSAAVGALVFQGAWQTPDQWRFAILRSVHNGFVPASDLALIQTLAPGRYLAPARQTPLCGDVIVLHRPGTTTVVGQPSLEFSGADMLELLDQCNRFFDPGTPEVDRRRIVGDQCVDYVFSPVQNAADSLAMLRALPWLEETGAMGGAMVFRVVPERTE